MYLLTRLTIYLLIHLVLLIHLLTNLLTNLLIRLLIHLLPSQVLSPRYEFEVGEKAEKKRKKRLAEEPNIRHPIFQVIVNLPPCLLDLCLDLEELRETRNNVAPV